MTPQNHPLPDLPLVDGCLMLDNSTLEKLACPRKMEYSWLRKREVSSNQAGRNFGSCLHLGWAYRYELLGTEEVKGQVKWCLHCKGKGFFSEEVNGVGVSKSACPTCHGAFSAPVNQQIEDVMARWMQESPGPDGDFRTFNHACLVMKAYCDNYKMEPFHILTAPKTGKPIVECAFMLPFAIYWKETGVICEWNGQSEPEKVVTSKGIPVYYTGKIDLGIENNDGIWSHDHKSAFQFGDSFIKQMGEDGGQRGYTWALGQIFGRPANGYIIDAVRIRKPLKRNEYSDIPPVDATDFQRLPFPMAPEEIESWRFDTLELIYTALHHYHRGYFPRHRWQCVSKYGPCDFIEVCSALPKFREHILGSSLFKESTWSPLNPTGEKE